MRVSVGHMRLRQGLSIMAVGAISILTAGCSASLSRFDFPMFGLTSSDPNDVGPTASLPTPPEPVPEANPPAYGYGTGNPGQPPRYTPPTAGRGSYSAYDYGPRGSRARPLPPPPRYAAAPQPPADITRNSYRPASPASRERVIIVRPGDTVYSLARQYGVTTTALMRANGLSEPNIKSGQRLRIPPSDMGYERAGRSSTASRLSTTSVPSQYRVKAGDTLYSLSRRFGVTQEALVAANGLQGANDLKAGQLLTIPTGGQARKRPERYALAPSRPATRTVAGRVRPTRVSLPATQARSNSRPAAAAKKLVRRKATPPKRTARAVAPAPRPLAGGRGKFRWPVRGRILSQFGPRKDGTHNDGINLAVPQGTSVKAAEDGIVAYAGNELKGYGNLILIRHANQWVSAYAHNAEILVKRGDRVKRGQIIAKAGKTGQVSIPQLHFELRKGSKPVNPLAYLSDS